jgi:acetyltransferase-like isoleucine patch superfamily enzyme
MPKSAPWSSRQGRMIFAFDGLWLIGLTLLWAPGAVAAVALLHKAAEVIGWPLAGALVPLAYLTFLFVTTLCVGLLGFLLPSPREGSARVFSDMAFFVFLLHWGLESALPRPLITHIQLLTSLRTLYYKLMGAKLGWSSHISPGATVSGAALLEMGHLTYIGEGAHIATHLSQGDKVLLAPVRLGDGTNVGAHCHIGPGNSFGRDVRLGALCDIAPGCWIEDEVELGPRCQLGMGVKVGIGSTLEPRSFVPSWTAVPAGEIWGGDPARKVADAASGAGAERRRRRRRG